jgi:DNA-binding phage protein
MSKKSVRPATRPQSSQRQAAANCINQALEKSDIAEICHAIAAATHLYNISDLARKSGLARPSLHRAFSGDPKKAQLHNCFECSRRNGFSVACHDETRRSARAARLKPVANCPEAGTKS